jgi:NAD(P)-dependent dehydrogenase (short-subunit alcohol dehydrogenase family)
MFANVEWAPSSGCGYERGPRTVSGPPTREDAELAFPAMQAIPVPYIEPQDVSNAVLFLAGDDSRFITGTQLRIDAGGLVKAKPWQG